MTTSNRRIALLTGASISALGISALVASPAFAAVPPPPHNGLADGTYTGIDTTTATLTICDIAVSPAPDSPCFTGVIDTTPPAFAQVSTPANGQIYQHDTGATVALDMINNGSAEVGAIAVATSTTFANAVAYNTIPILQTGSGGDVSLTIDNNGPLLLDAVASATGVFATAHAFIDGLHQSIGIGGADSAALTINNNDDMTVLASANASAVFASAYATLQSGIAQSAAGVGGPVDIELNNNGNLDINAVANASGSFADALANVTNGIFQNASATGSANAATAAVHNTVDAVINIGATANANAIVFGYATAYVSDGITQVANGYSGADASALVDNAGAINITAAAHVGGFSYVTGTGATATTVTHGPSVGEAFASLDGGIVQDANAYGNLYTTGDASAVIANDGTISIHAVADALATDDGFASAVADNHHAISQNAYASSGDAAASITGTGSIDIGATATANAAAFITGTGTTATTVTGGFAFASAYQTHAINQNATASSGGDATANITQGGTIDIAANAKATGSEAVANAYNWYGIDQNATANGGGDANATISIGGGDIHAKAVAYGTSSEAFAYATNYDAISQNAAAESGGDATISLTNTGDLAIQAVAHANAASTANATAYNEYGIWQTAAATGQTVVGTGATATTVGGNASITLTNDAAASIAINAIAHATGTRAYASATNYYGIFQSATAYGTGLTPVGGNASVAIANDGAISIGATAVAYGTSDASAFASVSNAINQFAHADDGGDASASLTGDGSIDVGAFARAVATDGVGSAYASVTSGISQFATASGGGDASVTLSQAGGIDVHATALAGGSTAYATANVNYAVYQSANANGGGDATASIALAGDNSVIAYASANATDSNAHAVANIGFATVTATKSGFPTGFSTAGGFSQYANASGGGDASATLTNSGSLTIGAKAVAVADETAVADAFVERGIYQSANATGGGDASASITNAVDASMSVLASATANGSTALAHANIKSGIGQHAAATGSGTGLTAVAGGNATASLTNNGSINVAAIASADASHGDASATAAIKSGVNQTANAADGDASVALTNSGSLTVSADANADAGTRVVGVGTTATTVVGDAFASASVGVGVFQAANGLNASANVYNTADGVIDVTATAKARGNNIAGTGTTTTGTGTTQVVTTFPTPGAIAFVRTGIHQNAYATGLTTVGTGATATLAGGVAAVSLTNDGSINVGAVATASGTGQVMASAAVDQGIRQDAGANGGDASASLDNTGSITVAATANATGGNAAGLAVSTGAATGTSAVPGAIASVQSGIHQVVHANAAVTATATTPTTGLGYTTINTGAVAGNASASLTNSGSIAVNANAVAVGTGAANASAFVGAGAHQEVSVSGTTVVSGTGTTATTALAIGDASASMVNSNSIAVGAAATATGTSAVAGATASYAMWQEVTATGGLASAYMTNTTSGVVSLSASANANGAGFASAAASANTAMYQEADAATVSAFMSNAGYVTATANAVAVASGTVTGTGATATTIGSAVAVAHAVGLGQDVGGTTGSATIVNSGVLNVGAHATAIGVTNAFASAVATGAYQETDPVAINFTNSGVMNVNAHALATGATFTTGTTSGGTTTTSFSPSGTAFASANGYLGTGSGGGALQVAIVNSGTMNVSASATAPGIATAVAHGIVLENEPTVTTVAGTPPVVTTNANPINGTIDNSGTLNVVAFASGGVTSATFTTPTTSGAGTGVTTVTTTTPLSSAVATGIRVNSGVNNLTITNSGAINVDAITANGGDATAYGIRVTSNGVATPLATDVLTINNAGDLIVRVSQDGGTTFQRGTAIDVSEAPNRTVINLMGAASGPANIYGNIELQSDADTINVTDGETTFNGVVNNILCGSFVGDLTLDDPAQNDCGVGTLNINDGGNLHLLNTAADGPSYVFMDTLDMRATAATGSTPGTITFDLSPATGGTAVLGTYPQVFVDTAFLDGTLVANIAAPNGLFETTTYENVIDAVTRTGTFDQCIIDGIPGNSLLLEFGCIYDDQANVDLGLTRVPFNEVPGLNQNGEQVGEGLECIFDVSLTGGVADMLADLFLISDPVNYNIALNQLAGSSYANYLQSFSSLGVHYNDILDHATSCEVPALAGSVLECRASAPIHVWGQLDYQTRKADGDSEAGTTKAKRFTGLLGVDASVGNAAILGVSAGMVSNHTRDHQFGDNIDADGMQVGAYAVYDPGPFYVKGVTTYSWYDGDSKRRIDFTGLGTGLTFAGEVTGDPDVKMWTAGLHGGARFPMGGSSVITPYLNLDYVHAKMDEFIEGTSTGAELHLGNNKSSHTFLTGGVKWATQMGGVVPEVNLGYRYRFGNQRTTITEAFQCQIDTCAFDIVSASQKRGTFLAGLSVGGKMGPVDIRVGYEGEFNSDVTSHSGNFKFVLPLGGHAAPPPPPPVVAPPPPPPPPPATQTCPDGSVILATDTCPAPPPPPPPPPPAPERGQ